MKPRKLMTPSGEFLWYVAHPYEGTKTVIIISPDGERIMSSTNEAGEYLGSGYGYDDGYAVTSGSIKKFLVSRGYLNAVS